MFYEILLEIRRRINVKHIIIGVLSVLILIIFFVFIRGGFVVLYAPSNAAITGYYQKSDSQEATMFNIKEDSWKLLYLENGKYSVEAVNETSESLYYKSVSSFSISSIDIALKPQKNALSLGYQNSDCIVPSNTQQTVWLDCGKSKDSNYQYTYTQDGVNYENQTAAPTAEVYKNGILEFRKGEDSSAQFITYLTFNDGVISKQKNSFPIKSASEEPTENLLITDPSDPNSSRFVYLNSKTNQGFVFNDISDDSPSKISIKDYVNEDDSDFISKIKLAGDKLYIYNGINSDMYLGHNEHHKEGKATQKLSVIDLSNNALDYQVEIPGNLFVTSFSVSEDGLIVFSAIDASNGDSNIYTIKDKKITPLNARNGVSSFCLYKNSIYFISSLRNGSIYEYSTSQSASFLVYRNQKDNIAGIQCAESGVYFYSLDRSNPESDYRWFRLEETDLTTDRIESTLPIFNDDLSGISFAYPYKNTLVIRLQNDGSCSVSDDERKEIAKYLQENEGINTDDFKLNIDRECY